MKTLFSCAAGLALVVCYGIERATGFNNPYARATTLTVARLIEVGAEKVLD